MTKIVAVSGSLRQASLNTRLLHAAASLMPEGASIDVRTLHGIPLYNADEEAQSGLPQAVTDLKDALATADAILFATPEYNNGLPGVFKNGVDWLSRPVSDIPKVFGGKRIAVVGASPGGFGTILAQDAWLSVLRMLGTEPWFGGRLIVSHASTLFDEQGNLVDEKFIERYRAFLADYVAWVRA